MKLVGVPDAQIVAGKDWIDLAYARRGATAWGYWAWGTMLWRAEDKDRSIIKRSMILQWVYVVTRKDAA